MKKYTKFFNPYNKINVYNAWKLPIPAGGYSDYGTEYTNSISAEINEKPNRYFYHPDHLGSTSYITDNNGEVSQHIEYIPFGETFVSEYKNAGYNSPYRFNAKEFDSNTGLYYFGARYMNPKYGLWLNPDPLGDFNPFMNSQHYIDGQHNGGVFNNRNLNAYAYCYQSPIRFIDPNGKQADVIINEKEKRINIHQKFIFYGTNATPQLSNSIANEIQYQFDNYGGTVKYNGSKGWNVKFHISYETVDINKAISMADNNTDRELNFIRIGTKNINNRSFMRNLGSNSGHWLISDDLGISSTAPHENAHGLGLDHENNQIGDGIPNIMAARGTLVEPQYQYDPKAKPGEAGGTVNPIYRRVRNKDIQGIINNIKTNSNGSKYIGSNNIDNTIFNESGKPL